MSFNLYVVYSQLGSSLIIATYYNYYKSRLVFYVYTCREYVTCEWSITYKTDSLTGCPSSALAPTIKINGKHLIWSQVKSISLLTENELTTVSLSDWSVIFEAIQTFSGSSFLKVRDCFLFCCFFFFIVSWISLALDKTTKISNVSHWHKKLWGLLFAILRHLKGQCV